MDRANKRWNWENCTAVIVAGGPSLRYSDILEAQCRLNAPKIIAVNESWKTCNSDIVYGADPDWWVDRGPVNDNALECWTQDKNWKPGLAASMGIKQIRSVSGANISTDPEYIYQGANSAFQAMNLAILFGAKRIVFTGLDLSAAPDGRKHWHEYPEKFDRRTPNGWNIFKASFEAAAPVLHDMGVEVINASRRTVLECFPRMTMEEALK